jgi:long-chain fatty acid transport protein
LNNVGFLAELFFYSSLLAIHLKSLIMTKFIALIFTVNFAVTVTFAGGIFTNTNQSASYIRMMARDASLEIDAVYYNPAGLTRLADGFHLSINNQFIRQNRSIYNNLASLNQNEYKGDLEAMVFPGIYAAYKTGNLAISAGLNPVGGGGSALYEDGLPSFETGTSRLVPDFGLMGYRNDIYFEGFSASFGGQLGISYELFGLFSIYGGGRFIMAYNTYEGYRRNFEVNTSEGWMKPAAYLTNFVAPTLTGMERTRILATANAVEAATADMEVDVVQRGNAIIPVVGVSIVPNDRFNIGIKYEFLTELELRNETAVDGSGRFPNRSTFRNDMPALLSVGAAYKAAPGLNIAGGVHYFFDKAADYGRTVAGSPVSNETVIDNDFIELALGLEYSLTRNFLVSAGYLRTQTGVRPNFQNDLSHSLSANNFGAGTRISFNEMIAVNLGFMMSFYDEASRSYTVNTIPVTETYNRDNIAFAIGIDLKF